MARTDTRGIAASATEQAALAVTGYWADGLFLPGAFKAQPVHQAVFEGWENPNIDATPAAAVPYFVRTLLVLSRLALDEAFRKDRRIESLLSGPRGIGIRVRVTREASPHRATDDTTVPLELVVLSRSSALQRVKVGEKIARTRSTIEKDLEDKWARFVDLARALSDDPVTLLIADAPRGSEVPVFPWPQRAQIWASLAVRSRFDPAELPARALTPIGERMPRSAALGWPSATMTGTAGGLSLRIGQERPIISTEAELAGRAEAFGLPAWMPAPGSAAVPEAFYVNFHDHVIFDRGEAPPPFAGPPAAHLSPVEPTTASVQRHHLDPKTRAAI